MFLLVPERIHNGVVGTPQKALSFAWPRTGGAAAGYGLAASEAAQLATVEVQGDLAEIIGCSDQRHRQAIDGSGEATRTLREQPCTRSGAAA